MRELRLLGSVRGVRSNVHSYRKHNRPIAGIDRLNFAAQELPFARERQSRAGVGPCAIEGVAVH